MSVFDDELREEFLDDDAAAGDFCDSESSAMIEDAENSEEMFEHYRFDVDKGQTPVRVDKYLASHMDIN